jgi:hypothetical protein
VRSRAHNFAVAAAGRCAAAVTVEAGGLHRLLLDGRWDAAQARTWHDWAAERRALRRELDRSGSTLSPAERARAEDDEIARRIAQRDLVEFPRAIGGYRDALAWLADFEGAEVDAEISGGTLEITVSVRLAAR